VSAHSAITNSRTILAVAVGRALSTLVRLLAKRPARNTIAAAAVCLGLAVQVGLCFTAMYLIDLSISLFELWADLARKHLELTL
jgi:NO-binding membrane sensor protein with MHYT domain